MKFYKRSSVPDDARKITATHTAGIVWLLMLCFFGSLSLSGQTILSEFENFNTDGTVQSIEYDENSGTIYIGGNFNRVGERYRFGAAVNGATLDVLADYAKVNGRVYSAVSDGAGGYYIGGTFTEVGGEPRSYIAQIDESGSVTSWDPSADGEVYKLLYNGTNVYVGGTFSTIGGESRSRLAAISPSTGLATSWDPSPNGSIRALITDGTYLYVGGEFWMMGADSRLRLASFDIATHTLQSWNPEANSTVRALAVYGSDIYVGGDFSAINGTARSYLASITDVGALNTWNPSPNFRLYDIQVGGNYLFVGGSFTTIAGSSRSKVASFDLTDGSLRPWSVSTISGSVFGLTVIPGGLFVGSTSAMKAYNFTTAEELAFDVGWSGGICYTIGYAGGSNVYIGGTGYLGGSQRSNLAAIDASTGEVLSWAPDPDSWVYDMVINGSELIVAGAFQNIGGEARRYLAAVSLSTGTASSWDLSPSGTVYTLFKSSNDLYVGGLFTFIQGTGSGKSNLVRVDLTTGNVDISWKTFPDSEVNSLAVSDHNTIYVGGNFDDIGGGRSSHLAEIDLTTGDLTTWAPGVNNEVYSVALDEDGTVYVGGGFTSIGGTSRNYLAAIDPLSGLVTSFDPSPNGGVYHVSFEGDVLYVGGNFSSILGETRQKAAAISGTETLLDWGFAGASSVNDIVQDGLNVYLGGNSFTQGDYFSEGFAAVTRPNGSPFDVALSNTSIEENSTANTLIGTFTSEDDPGDTHTYTLVSGAGDDGNANFSISGDELYNRKVLDFETAKTHTIRVRSEDGNGNGLEKNFTISVTNLIEKGTDILAFSLTQQTSAADIDVINHTVTINVSEEADITSLLPSVEVSSGADFSPKTAQDFSSPVNYTVTAENGSNQVWAVTVTDKLEGVYSVGPGGDYSELYFAAYELGQRGVNGDVIFEIMQGYGTQNFLPNFPVFSGADSYSVTIRPEENATSIELSGTGNAVRFSGNNYILDGADPVTGNSVMSIIVDGSETIAGVSMISVNTNIEIKNLTFRIADGKGIGTGGGNTIAMSNISIENCEFIATNTQSTANIEGINLLRFNLTNIDVIGNKFYNESGSPDPNWFIAMRISAQGPQGQIGGFDDVVNNSISIRGESTYGIINGANILHNTIHLYGSDVLTSKFHYGLSRYGNFASTRIENNVISVERSSGNGTTKGLGIAANDAIFENNNIYIHDDGVSTVQYATNTATSTEFAAIVPSTTFIQALFSDEATGDLSLTGANLTDPAFRGDGAGITKDIDGNTRSTEVPALGAYEHDNAIADIVSFDGANVLSTTVDNENNTVEFVLSNGSSATFAPTIGLYPEAQEISPSSGASQDFSSPVVYTVTAADGTQDDWTIINKIPNTEANITSFSVAEQTGPAIIDVANATVDIELGRDLPKPFTPTMTISDGATITAGYEIGEAISYGNYITDRTLTILSEDGLTSKDWTIRMTLDPYAAGTYTVGAGDDFEDLEEAIIALDKYGFDGDIVLELQADYPVSTPPSTTVRLDWLSVNDGHSLTIQPADDVTSLDIDLGTRNLFFVDMQNFTIDGKNKVTFKTTNPSYALILRGDADIKNVAFETEGSFFDSADGTLSIQNCQFTYSGSTISSNVFGVINSGTSLIFDSNIIDLGNGFNDTGASIIGVGYTDALIQNNVIIIDGVSLPTLKAISVLAAEPHEIEVYHNTFLVTGTASGTENITLFDVSSSSSSLATYRVNNNLMILDRDPGTSGKLVGINYENTLVKSYDGNHFFLRAGSHTRIYFEELGSTVYDDSNIGDMLTAWPETSIGAVSFVDATNGDLHLTGASLSDADLRATNIIAGVTEDAEGTTRSTFAPAKGAYEHPNTITEITSFDVPGQVGDEVISGTDIMLDVEATANLASLSAFIELSPGAGVNPASGATVDFTDPVDFTVTAEAGNTEVYTVTITKLNGAPAYAYPSSTSVNENAGADASVAVMLVSDPNAGDSHTFELVDGDGDDDNDEFYIDDDLLKAVGSFDHETQDAYSIRYRVTDQGGLFVEGSSTILIVDVTEAPTGITLNNVTIAENNSEDAVVGAFTAVDEDADETYTFTLIEAGSYPDNASFDIVDGQLLAIESFDYESKDEYSIHVQVSDGTYTYSKVFAIEITDEEPEQVVWNGSAWSNTDGPEGSDAVLIDGDFTGSFECDDLTVATGNTLNVDGSLVVNGDLINNGALVVSSGSSLITYEGNSITGNDLEVYRNTTYADGRYSFVGTPMEQTASVTDATIGEHVYSYDESQPYGSDEGLSRWVPMAGQLVPGVGYTQANKEAILFTGKPNASTVNVTGTYTGTYDDDTNEETEGFVLVANPYAAAISVADFLSENTNIEGQVYIWDDNGSDNGRGTNSDYIIANGSMATETTAGGHSRYNHALGSAQGFFVKLADDMDTEINFTPAMRVTGSNADNNFFRKANTPAYVRVNLTNETGLFKQTIVGRIAGISDESLDRSFDAKVFSSKAANLIYTLKDEKALAIQGISYKREVVPLAFNLAQAGIYKISVDLANAQGETFYLRDKLTDEIINLSTESYSFHSAVGQFADRFELVSNAKVLGLEANDIQVYAHDQTIYINMPVGTMRTFDVTGLDGRRVLTMQLSKPAQIQTNLPAGVYIITDGEQSHKIILK